MGLLWAPWVTQVRTSKRCATRLAGRLHCLGAFEAESDWRGSKMISFCSHANSLFRRVCRSRKNRRCCEESRRYPQRHDGRLDWRDGDRGGLKARLASNAESSSGMADLEVDTKGLRGGHRMEQGQPLPHASLLPRLQVGRQRDRARSGLEDLRREVMLRPLREKRDKSSFAPAAENRDGRRKSFALQLLVNIFVWLRSTRWSPAAMS